MKICSLCLVAALALLAGCASTPNNFKTHSMIPTPESATLVGKSVMMYLTETLNDLRFVEVDGVAVPSSAWSGMATKVPVSAGHHSITIHVAGYNYAEAQEAIDLECKARHVYRFATRRVGINFDLIVTEEPPGTKEGEGTVVVEKRVEGQQHSGPAYVPIFIPVH